MSILSIKVAERGVGRGEGYLTKFKVEGYPLYGPKRLFKFGEKGPIVCYCTCEQKMNFEGFTQNGCYGNQWLLWQPATAF